MLQSHRRFFLAQRMHGSEMGCRVFELRFETVVTDVPFRAPLTTKTKARAVTRAAALAAASLGGENVFLVGIFL